MCASCPGRPRDVAATLPVSWSTRRVAEVAGMSHAAAERGERGDVGWGTRVAVHCPWLGCPQGYLSGRAANLSSLTPHSANLSLRGTGDHPREVALTAVKRSAGRHRTAATVEPPTQVGDVTGVLGLLESGCQATPAHRSTNMADSLSWCAGCVSAGVDDETAVRTRSQPAPSWATARREPDSVTPGFSTPCPSRRW